MSRHVNPHLRWYSTSEDCRLSSRSWSRPPAWDIRDTVNPPRGFDQSAMLTSYRLWDYIEKNREYWPPSGKFKSYKTVCNLTLITKKCLCLLRLFVFVSLSLFVLVDATLYIMWTIHLLTVIVFLCSLVLGHWLWYFWYFHFYFILFIYLLFV